MANIVVGWDIGGAHLKAVLLDETGMAHQVWQLACPLWQGLERLSEAVDEVLESLEQEPALHAVTMTGELVDMFPDRKSGVRSIAQVMAGKVEEPYFYAGQKGFVPAEAVPSRLEYIASANWHASAQFLAHQVGTALFVDIGSTTSDFIPLVDGEVQNRGYIDAERMQHEELVYTGVVRTPLMALGSHVSFAGRQGALAAEHFATTADVYRLTGELDEAYDLAPTADGADKSAESSVRRIARMLCRDLDDLSLDDWKAVASAFRQMQLSKLEHAALHQFSRHSLSTAPLIAAGAGSFLAQALSKQLGREYRDVGEYVVAGTSRMLRSAAVCFPAYAVARLALESLA